MKCWKTLPGSGIQCTTQHSTESNPAYTWREIKKINHANANVSFKAHMWTNNAHLVYASQPAGHKDPCQTIKLNVKHRKCSGNCVQKTYMKMYVSFSFFFPVCLISLLLHLWITRRLFPQFCYLFCDFPQAISLSTPPTPPSPSLSGWPSTSFISARSSVCLPSFFWGGLISFPISLSYMLGEAPCMGVNEGAARVNTQEDR